MDLSVSPLNENKYITQNEDIHLCVTLKTQLRLVVLGRHCSLPFSKIYAVPFLFS